MNFARAASLALLVAQVAVQGCTRGAGMLELNETSAGQPVKTLIGQRLRMTLPENRTTGYRWQIAGDCSQILSQEDDQATAASSAPARSTLSSRRTTSRTAVWVV